MTPDSDDALSWDGDEHDAPSTPPLPKGWKAVGRGSESVAASSADADEDADADADADVARAVSAHDADPDVDRDDEPSDEHAGLSTAMLLTAGIVGGIYLLYSIGWVVGGLRLKPLANLIVADVMFLPWFVLAVAAPALWFLTVWVLTRGRAAWIRVTLLVLGVVLLVPWPFVTVGVIGS